MNALVSVCIPTYNHARVVGDALRSAIAQSYKNVEILIVDNHSADDTARVVAEIAEGDRRIRYIRHPENIGMSRNFSACIDLASGEYIKFLCADDILEQNCVAEMMAVALAHHQVSLIACARRMVDDNLNDVGLARYAERFVLLDGATAVRRCFFHGNLIGEPTAVLFRRSDAAGGFSNEYPQLMDLEMWFRILRQGAFAFLPEPLCRIRRHSAQATQANLRSGAVLTDKRRLFRGFLAEAGKHASLAEKALWDTRMAVTVGRTRGAGSAVDLSAINEVFFPSLFPGLTYPVASALWRFASRQNLD